MLLELVASRQVAEFRGVAFPLHGVAARPVTGRAGADLKRHADAVAGVPAAAAHLCQIPAGAEIARAHFRIGLEAAAGKDDGPGTQLVQTVIPADAHAVDAAVLVDDAHGTAIV